MVRYYLRVLDIGIYFGVVSVKSEVVLWERINKMFHFQEAHVYLIITTPIVVSGLSILLIKRFNVKTVDRRPLTYQAKPFYWGILPGGTIFGTGRAITGACPGPIYAQTRGREWLALVTFAGALTGMSLYSILRPKLPN